MLSIILNEYTLLISNEYLDDLRESQNPESFLEVIKHEDVVASKSFFVVIAKEGKELLRLAVAYSQSASESGFHPGFVLVPETHLLFVGAGEKLVLYKWDPPEKLWEEDIMVGFWGWQRYRDVIIMSAELQLTVWDRDGKKLWSQYTGSKNLDRGKAGNKID